MFAKAKKENVPFKMAIYGPSGSGKTLTALKIATGIGGKISLIDTEYGRSKHYADRFDFGVEIPEKKDIDTLIDLMAQSIEAKTEILIIDSLSHMWQELLDEVNKIANTRFNGNTWSAWSFGTPKQKKLIKAILRYPGFLIATMRVKTEWLISKDDNNKTKIERSGAAPEQGKGIEYEFDLLCEMNQHHLLTISKDVTGKFQDKIIENPDEKIGEEIRIWSGIKKEESIKPIENDVAEEQLDIF